MKSVNFLLSYRGQVAAAKWDICGGFFAPCGRAKAGLDSHLLGAHSGKGRALRGGGNVRRTADFMLKTEEWHMEKDKLEIIPYLSMEGNCEEAIHTYLEIFGGEILCLSRWPQGMPGRAGKVMHAEFTLGSTRMSAGDGFTGEPVNGAFKLMVHRDSKEDALRLIAALQKGGCILSPLKPHPAPDDGGCGCILKDRFGYTWIVTCPNPDKQPG